MTASRHWSEKLKKKEETRGRKCEDILNAGTKKR